MSPQFISIMWHHRHLAHLSTSRNDDVPKLIIIAITHGQRNQQSPFHLIHEKSPKGTRGFVGVLRRSVPWQQSWVLSLNNCSIYHVINCKSNEVKNWVHFIGHHLSLHTIICWQIRPQPLPHGLFYLLPASMAHPHSQYCRLVLDCAQNTHQTDLKFSQ